MAEIEQTGIERMRNAVRSFDACNETFLSHFTPVQLLRLHAAWKACEWDLFPDQWEVRQALAAARRGVVPAFKYTDAGDKRGAGLLVAVYSKDQKRVRA
jgi:hypothetical protein